MNTLRTEGYGPAFLGLMSVLMAAPAAAQSAATTVQVIELNYAPAAPLMGLDLRAGRYLLELRGPVNGPYQGVLYGPNNEVVDERLSIGPVSCLTGGPASGRLSTTLGVARPAINPLGLSVTTSSGCQFSASAHTIGLPNITGIPDVVKDICTESPDPEPNSGAAPANRGPGPVLCSPPEPLDQIAADLTPGPGIWIAGQDRPWDGTVVLPSTAAVARSAGRCFFNYRYQVKNIGRATSGPTYSALTLNRPFNPQLDLRGLPELNPGAVSTVEGNFALPPGRWRLILHVDSPYAVAELNGSDNLRVLRVEVSGRCDGATP